MEVDDNRLNELRKKTRLNIIEKLKLNRLINLAVAKKKFIDQLEHCDIETNLSEANNYEYSIRLRKYNRNRRYKGYGRYY